MLAGSRALLRDAALRRGYAVAPDERGLRLGRGGEWRILRWPPRASVLKSEIPPLMEECITAVSCPTRLLTASAPTKPTWLPGCLKPDAGSRGRGFQSYRDEAEWLALIQRLDWAESWVVQPLVEGVERRITVFASGSFVAARRLCARGTMSEWMDDTPSVPIALADDLVRVVDELGIAAVGFDVIDADDAHVVLDVNIDPALHIHVQDHPQIADEYLTAWESSTFACRRVE